MARHQRDLTSTITIDNNFNWQNEGWDNPAFLVSVVFSCGSQAGTHAVFRKVVSLTSRWHYPDRRLTER